MKHYIKRPMSIEKKSFEIIEKKIGKHNFTKQQLMIVKRIIHTTADFEYKKLIYFSENFVEKALESLKKSPLIYTDTKMIAAGINKNALEKLNAKIVNYISDKDVYEISEKKQITRSMAAIEKAVNKKINIFVIGNAPTALFKIKELIDKKILNPDFVVGVPVGFVGAKESKELIQTINFPVITINGNKGGSTVAAAIINALLYLIIKR